MKHSEQGANREPLHSIIPAIAEQPSPGAGTPDGIAHLSFVCNPRGHVEIVNLHWLDYTGFTDRQSFGEGWRCAIHFDDLARFEDRWDAGIAARQPFEIKVRLRRRDGVFRATIFNLMPLHEPSGGVKQWYVSTTVGSTSSLVDGVEEAGALGAQHEELSQAQLRTIIDAIPILAWSTAKDGPGEFLNKRWLDYTGLSLQEAIGYGWRAVIHPDDLDSLFEYWQWMMRTGLAGEYEARMRRFDGEYRWFLFRGAPLLDSTGSVSKWFGVNIDIDDRKGAEAALRRTQAALSRSSQLATLGELTASIAHEVNQPLAAIVANAEAGLQWLDKEKPNLDGVRKALQRIVRDGSDAGEIVKRLRSLFRRAVPTTAEHRIEELVTEVLKLLEHETSRRRISVDVDLGKGLPTVWCDRLQIQQVILNLMVNAMDALDAAPHGEKTIRIFANWDGAGSIVLGIRDYGPGVQDTTRLFETFFTTKENGLGMGLAISRSIVEAHGGQLWLELTEGPGSTFCFRLPVKRPILTQI
jgi:PAS domain S-box-containing protein